MMLKPWIKIVIVGASLLTLAACSTGRKMNSKDAVSGENSAYSDASSTGVSDESRFGDQAGGKRVAANGRVYYFDYASNVVHENDKESIANNAAKIASSASNAMIEGHTDPRGSREYNIGLGERRAKSVAQLMTAKGVDPKQLRVVSYGAEKPASPGNSEADFQQDRRVVLIDSAS
jgi:peptidoglycan-associated lipoprotein